MTSGQIEAWYIASVLPLFYRVWHESFCWFPWTLAVHMGHASIFFVKTPAVYSRFLLAHQLVNVFVRNICVQLFFHVSLQDMLFLFSFTWLCICSIVHFLRFCMNYVCARIASVNAHYMATINWCIYHIWDHYSMKTNLLFRCHFRINVLLRIYKQKYFIILTSVIYI